MIEILDTTLRDGEQTSGVSFAAQEKLGIARLLLEELHVDRVEIASARVSDGEFEAVRKVAQWAQANGHIDRVEVLGFVDGRTSLEWIHRAGCRVLNLLCKGSLKHCLKQLKKKQHLLMTLNLRNLRLRIPNNFSLMRLLKMKKISESNKFL